MPVFSLFDRVKRFITRYSLQFWLLCLSSFLFFASFNMIIPELPDYLTSLGGAEYKGLIISLFTLTAMISRPFSGKLTDRIGRIPVMVFGAGVCFVIGFLYPMISSVAGFMLVRLFHGFSTGFKPTGTVAYVADIVPAERRGEAMGYSGVFGTLGMSSGPPIGVAITEHFSLDIMFYTSSAFAILSVLVLLGMKETLENRERFRLEHLEIHRNEIIDKSALPVAVFMMLTVYSYGVILTIIPDFSDHLGINKGLFFTIFTLSSLIVRLFAGHVSDRFGREPVLFISGTLFIIALLIIAFSTTLWMFVAGGIVFGLASGVNTPTLFAWTIDRCRPENRGRAMSTTFIGLELGIMVGALISGFTFANDPENFPLTFIVPAVSCALALIFLVVLHLRGTARLFSTQRK